ncbi:MAG: hypothetical protein ACI8ZM_003670 [Crocinitomix sp.]|jgi:hypothetical protein
MIQQLKVLFLSLLFFPYLIFSQAPPPLGATSSFVIYTATGAVTNTGFSQITGDVGPNIGATTGFGNINGTMHSADATTAQCAIDLSIARDSINLQPHGVVHSLTLGAGEVLTPEVYLLAGASSCTGSITLDGGGDPDACFIFKLDGAFAAAAASTVILTNGTQACNVFWRIDGATAIAANSIWKGTLIISGATAVAADCNLEGRLLNVTGAISVSSLTGGPPIGCGSPIFTGPVAPDQNSICDFAIFTSIGIVTNTGTTNVVGDIGTNLGTVSGYNPPDVTGTVHSIPDVATAQASLDLTTLYAEINGFGHDIELLYPAVFGHSQVLTPNVYLMTGAATLTDTIFLDARGVSGAVFVIRITGAFTTSTPQVILVGGTLAENVFWQVEGAVTISTGANFNGTIIANNAAIILESGVILTGKVLSTNGDITTQNVDISNTFCPFLLPTELLSFSVEEMPGNIAINWVTASEKNNNYFNVERSADGINFSSIGKINGAGNSTQTLNYSFFDDNPLIGMSYYRLKQTDYDGATTYSNTKSVACDFTNGLLFSVYPNPFSGETTIHIAKKVKDSKLVIFDSYGHIIKQITNISEQTFTLHCEDLSRGIYFINLMRNGKIVATEKLVITN